MHSVVLLILLCDMPVYNATQIYDRAMALAQAQKWMEAETALLAGYRQHPNDKRFPLELAGINFRRKELEVSRMYLKEALAIEPSDSYAINFLGAIYLLEGNVEAALLYWNRINKPYIASIQLIPNPNTNQVLFDRALAVSPSSVLQLENLRKSVRILELTDLFARTNFRLVAHTDESFDLQLIVPQKASFGKGKLQTAVSLLRGLPYETLHLDLYDIKRSGWNSTSFFRWDSDKTRLFTSLSGPLNKEPSLRTEIGYTFADENWDLSLSSADTRSIFELEKHEVTAGFEKLVNAGWRWNAKIHLSHRNSRNDELASVTEGFALGIEPGLNNRFYENAENGWRAEWSARGKLARIFSDDSLYTKIQGGILAEWIKSSYSTRMQMRAGLTTGSPPIDEFFALGIDRDSDLWLRGHQLDDKKGSIPTGRKFALWNSEAGKIVYKHPLFSASIGPFLDAGRTWDFSTERWLFDAGLQTKWRTLFGYTLTVSYGRQLQSGGDTLFFFVTN